MLVAGITDSYPSREKAGISGSLFSLNFDVEYFVGCCTVYEFAKGSLNVNQGVSMVVACVMCNVEFCLSHAQLCR